MQTRAQEYDKNTRDSADRYAADVKNKLMDQSKVLEENIQGLKQFEAGYRSKLTEFLNQLINQISDTSNYQSMEKKSEQAH